MFTDVRISTGSNAWQCFTFSAEGFDLVGSFLDKEVKQLQYSGSNDKASVFSYKKVLSLKTIKIKIFMEINLFYLCITVNTFITQCQASHFIDLVFSFFFTFVSVVFISINNVNMSCQLGWLPNPGALVFCCG